jgi:hypothetical protein
MKYLLFSFLLISAAQAQVVDSTLQAEIKKNVTIRASAEVSWGTDLFN